MSVQVQINCVQLRPALRSEGDRDRQVLAAAAQPALKGNTIEPMHMLFHDRTHDRVKLISMFPHYLDREYAGKLASFAESGGLLEG